MGQEDGAGRKLIPPSPPTVTIRRHRNPFSVAVALVPDGGSWLTMGIAV